MTPQGAATPSDEEIMAWAMEHQPYVIKTLRGSGFVRVVRAVLARWGAPQAPDLLLKRAETKTDEYFGPFRDADAVYGKTLSVYATTKPLQQSEPVAWRYRMSGDLQWQYTERFEQTTHATEVQRVYAAPQPLQQRELVRVPLTDAQIEEICASVYDLLRHAHEPDNLIVARAIEAAHGIKTLSA